MNPTSLGGYVVLWGKLMGNITPCISLFYVFKAQGCANGFKVNGVTEFMDCNRTLNVSQ